MEKVLDMMQLLRNTSKRPPGRGAGEVFRCERRSACRLAASGLMRGAVRQ